jgi:hypothetical protein
MRIPYTRGRRRGVRPAASPRVREPDERMVESLEAGVVGADVVALL